MDYKYSYLFFDFLFFVPWILLFSHRKDLRKEMLVMGIVIAIGSYLTANFWTIDWWRPQTISGTRVGIEDFLLGMLNGGVGVVLYEELFRKRLYKRNEKVHEFGILMLVFITLAIFFFSFYLLHFTSFFACIISGALFGFLLLLLRRDLFIPSLLNALLMLSLSLVIYNILIIVFPQFVERTYLFKTLTGIKLTGIPVEEFIFYFFFGLAIIPMYEYWQGLKLRSIPSKSKRRK